VVMLAPDTRLQDAARTFAEANISGAPVVDANGRLVGVLSSHDVARPENVRDGAPSERDGYRQRDAAEREGDFGDDEEEIMSMSYYRSESLRSGVVTDYMSP